MDDEPRIFSLAKLPNDQVFRQVTACIAALRCSRTDLPLTPSRISSLTHVGTQDVVNCMKSLKEVGEYIRDSQDQDKKKTDPGASKVGQEDDECRAERSDTPSIRDALLEINILEPVLSELCKRDDITLSGLRHLKSMARKDKLTTGWIIKQLRNGNGSIETRSSHGPYAPNGDALRSMNQPKSEFDPEQQKKNNQKIREYLKKIGHSSQIDNYDIDRVLPIDQQTALNQLNSMKRAEDEKSRPPSGTGSGPA